MIIWSGLGFLVVLIGFGNLILMQLIANAIAGSDTFYQDHSSVLAANGLLIASVEIYFMSKWLANRKTFKRNHSLFFIEMEKWPVVLFVLALFTLVSGFSD